MKKGMLLMFTMMIVTSLLGIHITPVQAADQYDTIRDKWKVMLTGGTGISITDTDIAAKITAITNQASTWQSSIVRTSTRYQVWNDLGYRYDTANITKHYQRIRDMALAYSTTGSSLYGNASLKTDILDALETVYTQKYNETFVKSGASGWYDLEIGAQLPFLDTLSLMYSDLATAYPDRLTKYLSALEYFASYDDGTGTLVSDPGKYGNGGYISTAANLAWKCEVEAKRGIITKDSAAIQEGVSKISGIYDYIDGTGADDGFFTDGSFIQHHYFAYNGGYGNAMLSTAATMFYLFNGTAWDVMNSVNTVYDADYVHVFEWVLNGYKPFIYKGDMMPMVMGRDISRYSNDNHYRGHNVISNVVRLVQSAPTAYNADFKSLIKYWIQQDTYSSFYQDAGTSVWTITNAKSIVSSAASLIASEFYSQFANMDKAVAFRSNFALGISMFSNRTKPFESINGENKKGWHLSDGMTYLYNADLGQFSGDYWPTIDSYRLPGTTVEQASEPAGNQGSKSWVGGASLQGTYGVSGMQLKPSGQTLNANKSWFVFDDEIVALGSGITSTDGKTIETIVENRKLNSSGNNALTVGGTAKSTTLGWNESMSNVTWVHLAGSVSGSDIGYYFPGGTSLNGLREQRSGLWNDINTNSAFQTSGTRTNNFLTLWMDHGVDAASKNSYSYVLLPGMTSSQVSSYANNPAITILENSTDAAAVKETALGLTGITFWNDINKTVGGITSNKKAAVMMKETSSDLEISVSDPTNANTSAIQLELAQSAASVLTADPRITVTQLSPTIKLAVNVSGGLGRSFSVKFSKGTSATTTIVDDSNASITYSGSWTHTSDANFYNATKSVTGTTTVAGTGKATYTFTGTTVRVYAKKLAGGGMVDVKVDGVSRGTFDTYSSTDVYKAKVFELTGLTSGSHTIELSMNASHNSSATAYYFGFDYFEYVN
ncbi:polysaccharide lyase family 8 super-sandwich domain-containing protein [Paenibacillus roseipurpureus]|uniref:Polysaccharide lyase family 8 super-sandwich domain-containing protein n=1 Tax=Paenibacillus roseopurpureus TaxID=2918901 RepID=A0AA96LTB1_9BACL|nr:polysaccharide lyase family 8 super-sandwich domain-containing protein [Paenibacillus sp. MBLB1832]WNR45684.1 polysaccharide lyase family 8 super-sandwich domain-containing protein [Paenibacillus sp. MBLB1832]